MKRYWNLCYLRRESQSLCALTLNLNVLRTLTCVRVVIRIFQVTPQQEDLNKERNQAWIVGATHKLRTQIASLQSED
jgi:hypothetical protein